MNFEEYFDKMPEELISGGETNELKMLKAYAYNAYFNADIVRTDDVLSGISYSRKTKFGIDGVFLNESLEEDTIECVYAYYVSDGIFNQVDALKAISQIAAQIDEVRQKRYITNDKSDSLLGEYINDFVSEDSKINIVIRIVTNYDPEEKDKYEITKKIESYPVSVKGMNVSAAITFGDDLLAIIESNTAPFDYVAEGKLVVDSSENKLEYGEDSFICNISAQSLKKIWNLEGTRGLLAMNLRYYIKKADIDNKIEDSIFYNSDKFWYLNNGIIIVCDNYFFKGNELHLTNFSIVNGGQTTRMIGTIPFDHDFYVSCKVVKNNFTTESDKNIFISQVAEASNTQKPIKAKDIIANKIEQRNLKSLMSANGIFIEIKRGEKFNPAVHKEPWQRTKNNELAQDLYSFVFMEPGPARNNVSKFLQSQEKYDLVFKNHTYEFEFLKSLLILEKCFREYQKSVSKDEVSSPEKKGITKNGLYYMLAVIGYFLKLAYNSEFKSDMQKYHNNDVMFELCSSEPAFNNKFVSSKITYAEFKKYAFQLFDVLLNNLIVPEFVEAKSKNSSLAYSNWTKSNTGFNAIRRSINFKLFDRKDDEFVLFVKKFFLNVDEETTNKNIDMYVDYCKKNKKISSKTFSGFELNSDDEGLRNDLMIFRQTYSLTKHIPEKNIFTDKMLDRMVTEKPLTIDELKKICSSTTCYFCGKDLLKIIEKHI